MQKYVVGDILTYSTIEKPYVGEVTNIERDFLSIKLTNGKGIIAPAYSEHLSIYGVAPGSILVCMQGVDEFVEGHLYFVTDEDFSRDIQIVNEHFRRVGWVEPAFLNQLSTCGPKFKRGDRVVYQGYPGVLERNVNKTLWIFVCDYPDPTYLHSASSDLPEELTKSPMFKDRCYFVREDEVSPEPTK